MPRRGSKLPRLAAPGPAEREWIATCRDLAQRIGEIWMRALDGWNEHLERDPKHVFPKKDASGPDVPHIVHRLRIQTEQTIDASGLDEAADEVGEKVKNYCSAELKRVFGIPTSRILSPEIVDGFRQRNVALIKNMANEELDTVGELLREADAKGTRVADLAKQIQERTGVAESRATLIARDQVGKLNAQISRQRQQDAGLSEYTWSTSGDDRVREGHADLNGTRQSWDSPPVVDEEEGTTAHPGEDYSCRCVAVPVIPWLEDPDDESAGFENE